MRALTSRRRHPPCWVLVLSFLTLLTWPHPAVGQDQRAVLELVLNGVPKGDALVLLRDADVWVAVGPLATAGLEGFAGTRERHGDEEFVSLQSLSELVAFSVNELDLRLNVTAVPRALGVDVRDFGIGAPANMIFRSSSSAFVNYALNWSGHGGVSLFTESAARIGGALLHSTVSADRGRATRGLSSVTVDERQAMRRWVVGDSYAYSGPLGGDAWMAGVSVAREFSLDPYYVRHPELSLSAPVALPSTLEVHLNGRIVSQQEVAPGRIDVRNLPLTMGRNDARVVVRDAFGGSREVSTSYYLTTSALARGVHDYQYSFGFRRRALGSTSWDYASPAALARHRVGLTDSVTAGGRVELGAGVFNAGPAINLRLPFGEVEGAAALSRSPRGWGSGVLVGYNYSGRPISGGGSLSLTGHHYTTLGESAVLERPTAEASVFASAAVNRRLSLTAQHNRSTFRTFTRDRSSLVANVHISRYVELTSSATWGREADEPDRELFAGLTFLFGRSSAAFSTIRDAGATRSMVETQRPLPVGTGYGYQFRAEGGAQDLVSGQGRYQNQYGRYELRRDVIAGEAQTTLSAAGAVVGIGGRTFASRPVYESFAVISVPGVEGVRGFASNQEVGRTTRGGQLLVPDLPAYYGNLLSIADTDVPLDYGIAAASMALALPYRGGAVATFPVRAVRRITGRLRVYVDGGEHVPAYGELRVVVDGREEISPVGAGGEFYFENLPAGEFGAVVESRDLACELRLAVPEIADPMVDLGTVGCTAPAPGQRAPAGAGRP